jgi:hypothetical protein
LDRHQHRVIAEDVDDRHRNRISAGPKVMCGGVFSPLVAVATRPNFD